MGYSIVAIELDSPIHAEELGVRLEQGPHTWPESSEKKRPQGRVAEFYDSITRHYAEPGETPDAERFPWDVEFVGPWEGAIEMSLVRSPIQEVLPRAIELAMETGVSTFDLETGLAYHPPRITESTGATVSSPELAHQMHGYPELIEDLVELLPDRANPFVVVDRDDETYMQAMWTEEGWLLEHRAGGPDAHYSLEPAMATAEQVRDALIDYMRDGSAWRRLAFSKLTL